MSLGGKGRREDIGGRCVVVVEQYIYTRSIFRAIPKALSPDIEQGILGPSAPPLCIKIYG